jgi:hypothetical protein
LQQALWYVIFCANSGLYGANGRKMKNFNDLLAGNDLRSLGESSKIISMIDDQKSFDALFEYLYSEDRKIVMKTIDVIEKITARKFDFLQKHKSKIMDLSLSAKNIELKWHLAQLLGRLHYTDDETITVWALLKKWALNKNESKIVRVNSLQTLYDIAKTAKGFETEFKKIIEELSKENIPSMNARIKKLS